MKENYLGSEQDQKYIAAYLENIRALDPIEIATLPDPIKMSDTLRMERLAHTGLDIYVPAGTPVYATISGTVSLAHREVEDVNGVEVRGECVVVRYLMLDHREAEIGGTVQQGDLLGYVALPSEKSAIIYSPVVGNASHLHLEVEDGGEYLNHLYFSKIGTLSLPFRL